MMIYFISERWEAHDRKWPHRSKTKDRFWTWSHKRSSDTRRCVRVMWRSVAAEENQWEPAEPPQWSTDVGGPQKVPDLLTGSQTSVSFCSLCSCRSQRTWGRCTVKWSSSTALFTVTRTRETCWSTSVPAARRPRLSCWITASIRWEICRRKFHLF